MCCVFNLRQANTKSIAPKSAAKRKLKTQMHTPTMYINYSEEDVHKGLFALIHGKSKRAASELSGVPANTLARHFIHLTGKRPNVKAPLNKQQRQEAINKLVNNR